MPALGVEELWIGICRLDSRHTDNIKNARCRFRAPIPVWHRPEGWSFDPTGSIASPRTRANQKQLMTAISSTIANANTPITGAGSACEAIEAAGRRPWRDSFLGRKRRLLAYAALLAAGICAAAAEEGPVARPNAPMEFHIPSQPLATALQVYGQRTGIQVLYESNSAIGRMSAAVEGSFAPEAALGMLLAGTDLRVRYTRPDAIILSPAYVEGVSARLSSPLSGTDLSLGTLRVHGSRDGDETARLNEYSERVQMDIQDALRRNARTRDGTYRAVLDLWIDPARTIVRTDLFRSTGDRERDSAIATTLRGVTISRPAPANAPQPVRVSIIVKSLQ